MAVHGLGLLMFVVRMRNFIIFPGKKFFVVVSNDHDTNFWNDTWLGDIVSFSRLSILLEDQVS